MADLGEDPTDSIAKGIELATRATHRQSLINLFMTRAYWYTETGAYAAALEDLACGRYLGGNPPRWSLRPSKISNRDDPLL